MSQLTPSSSPEQYRSEASDQATSDFRDVTANWAPDQATEMDPSEARLWNIVDIKGYAAFSFALSMNVNGLQKGLEIGDLGYAERCLERIESTCPEMNSRVQEIDLDQLDERFPLALLKDLVERTPEVLESTVDACRRAFEVQDFPQEEVEGVRASIDLFTQSNILNHPRYRIYRKFFADQAGFARR